MTVKNIDGEKIVDYSVDTNKIIGLDESLNNKSLIKLEKTFNSENLVAVKDLYGQIYTFYYNENYGDLNTVYINMYTEDATDNIYFRVQQQTAGTNGDLLEVITEKVVNNDDKYTTIAFNFDIAPMEGMLSFEIKGDATVYVKKITVI